MRQLPHLPHCGYGPAPDWSTSGQTSILENIVFNSGMLYFNLASVCLSSYFMIGVLGFYREKQSSYSFLFHIKFCCSYFNHDSYNIMKKDIYCVSRGKQISQKLTT